MNAKLANSLIIGLVLAGTVFLSSLALPGEANLMPAIFLGFFALIIVLQLVPAMMLFTLFLKQAFGRVAKEKDAANKGQ
ncbi:MAG: hypothetical protein IH614_18530 [Desulfuromonadales bacterium]|nr:hypothetical protein [Desulfuromonadales bacterium]